MNLFIYIILGILQGFTEPLPISSSGHLVLFKNLFNTNISNDLNLEIFTNFGSFIAILIIFLPDVIKLLKAFFTYIFNKEKRKENKNDYSYCLKIIITTIPVAIIGALFKDTIENLLSNIKILSLTFLITALSLLLVKNKKGIKEDKDITYKDAFIIGILQVIALMPGISRSGAVLVGCLLCNLKRENALKYTFIAYFPVSIASMGLGILDFIKSPNTSLLIPYIISMLASSLITYFSYLWLSKIVKKGKLWKFSIYCLILSLFIFLYF